MVLQGHACEDVKRYISNDMAKYLCRKLAGGKANDDGGKYESHFAVWMIANTAADILNGLADDATQVATQFPGFVDDFVLYKPANNEKYSYQLKNSPSITWGRKSAGAARSIWEDFNAHYKMDMFYEYRSSFTILTVSDLDTFERLNSSIPSEIAAHTKCVYFKAIDSINRALLGGHTMRSTLEKICVTTDIDKLVQLHTVLTGVWSNYSSQAIKVTDLIEEVRKIKPEYLINPISFVLDSSVMSILEKIPGFSYSIVGNYLTYSYSSCSGDCMTGGKSFDESGHGEFEKTILDRKPESFQELFELGILQ